VFACAPGFWQASKQISTLSLTGLALSWRENELVNQANNKRSALESILIGSQYLNLCAWLYCDVGIAFAENLNSVWP